MKFLTKLNRNLLLLFAAILTAISIPGYFILHNIIVNSAREGILNEEELIVKQITKTGEIPFLYPLVEVRKIKDFIPAKPEYREITIKNDLENEADTYLEYSNTRMIKGSMYSIKLREATFESSDLALTIAITLLILLSAILLVSFIITQRLNKTIWASFTYNLNEFEKFSFAENDSLALKPTNIEEFNRLDRVIVKLTDKLKKDYLALKEFTEDASHEIQTPLSVVMLNLEELIQHKLPRESFEKVVASIKAIKRLSVLNQSLLLLSKIDNGQFPQAGNLSLNEILERKIQEFEPLIQAGQLEVKLTSEASFSINMNPQLSEILTNNLLSNAINHNISGGFIHITLKEDEMSICNSGAKNHLTNETIFNRFVKGNSKSHGLGLAIVKRICETHHLQISYTSDPYHFFRIRKINSHLP